MGTAGNVDNGAILASIVQIRATVTQAKGKVKMGTTEKAAKADTDTRAKAGDKSTVLMTRGMTRANGGTAATVATMDNGNCRQERMMVQLVTLDWQ